MRYTSRGLAVWAGVVVSVMSLVAGGAEGEVSLTVDPGRVVGRVDDKIYGQFLEHIYHSCNGGVWGEVVWNRSFEEVLGGDPRVVKAGVMETPARHWLVMGMAEISLDIDQPLNSKRSLKIVSGAGENGVAQRHYNLRKGDTCRGSLWLRGEATGGVLVRLVDGQKILAENILSASSAQWQQFPLELSPDDDCGDGTLQIIVRGKGTIWLDQVSLMPDSSAATGGFRPDLLKAVIDMKPATIRWPGGSFVGGYNWKNGIGPQHKRIEKKGWDELDPLSFGIDEFMAFCRKVGSQPVVVVYAGPGNRPEVRPQYIQDACDFVEYCNGPATSKWGAVRATNGHPEPYGVKYWEIDNEIWGMKADQYAGIVKEFVPAMKKIDPTIVTIACGSGQLGKKWGEGDVAVIEQCADVVDYLSIHHYESPGRYADGPADAEKFWNLLGEQIAKSKNPKLKLYMSEWNAQSTDWRTGLYAGGILNAFERNPVVEMACPALWLRHVTAPSWDNAFINFDQRGWFPAPNYIVMKLYRDHYAADRIELGGEAGGLNVMATRSADGAKLYCKAVNPTDKAVAVRLEIKGDFAPGSAGLQLVAPDDLSARNTMENPNAVRVIEGKVEREGAIVRFTLPQWSVGVVSVGRR